MDKPIGDATTSAGDPSAAAEAQSFVRHELRTPLAVMQPLLGMLLDGASGPPDEKQAGYLRMLERNVERLSAMITSLVETGWLEVAAIPPRPETLDARELVEQTVADVRASLETTPRTEVVVGDDLPLIVGDAYRLQRALRNVVVNACTYTPAGGEVIVAAVAEDGRKRVLVTVSDTGPGIEPDDLPRVFDVGYRGELARELGAQGLGLGLPAARALVEGLGGSLSLVSAPGEGARVTFGLPAAG